MPLAYVARWVLAHERLKDEVLLRETFDTLPEEKILVEQWRGHHNHVRSHSALGYMSIEPEATEKLILDAVEIKMRFRTI